MILTKIFHSGIIEVKGHKGHKGHFFPFHDVEKKYFIYIYKDWKKGALSAPFVHNPQEGGEMMGNKTMPGEVMLTTIQELSSKYHVSDTVASMAVLSATICRIHDDLRRISRNMERIMEPDGENALIRVCGEMNTYEQN